MNATVSIICYRQEKIKNDEHPIMIRVAKGGKTKYKSLGISVHPDNWDFQTNRPKLKCPNRELILKTILEKEVEYQKEIIELTSMQKEYTASTLITSKTNQINAKTVGKFLEEYVKQLEKDNRINYAISFKHTWHSLKKFCGNNLDFVFSDIDANFLKKYEQWLKDNKCSEVTIAHVFRNIRSIFNKAIKEKCAIKSTYPFDEFKVSKFDVSTQKRAISKDDIKKIMAIDLSKELFYTQFSRDIFIFSYLCGGINFIDIANLKVENIVDNILMYTRKKTYKKIKTPLSTEALKIIQKYSSEKPNSNDYLFPVLNDDIHKTKMQKFHRCQKVLRRINLALKTVAELTNINTNLTTYVARHSFATILKKSGVNISIISESLGHSDEATTQIYLDSFDDDQLQEAFKNLL